MIDFLIFAVVGIVTGTMAGLFGVGGGLIIVPVMHRWDILMRLASPQLLELL